VSEPSDKEDARTSLAAAASSTGTGDAFFVFQIASTHVAVRAEQVEGVLAANDPTPIPSTPGYILGLVPYGETTLPIIDPARFLDLDEEEETGGEGAETRVVVLRSGAMQVGLHCGRAIGVVAVDKPKLLPASVLSGGRLQEFLRAEFEATEARVGVLDVAAMLGAARITPAGGGSTG